jgi:cell division protein FtsA
MFESNRIIVGLEIGTSKVCAMVGELNDEGSVNLIGVGQSISRGVRKGEISDPTAAEEDVRKALADAEVMANVEVRSVYLGVSGSHMRGFNNRGIHTVPSHDRAIDDDDVQDVIKNAKVINLPKDHVVLHSVRQHFTVDGQSHVINPVGLYGGKLEVDMHVIHGNNNRVQNPIRLVKGMQLEVEAVVFNGIASSLSVLTNEQKNLGALIIDIGGGTTEYVVYSEGIIKHSGVLGVGGDHISNDLAYGLKISLGRAEELKIAKGAALMDDEARGQTITLESEVGMAPRVLNLEHLRRIMSIRLEEIFHLIEEDLSSQHLMDYIRSGVFITGGGARIPQIRKLAEDTFRLPSTIGHANSIGGLKSSTEQPEFATAIGLVKFGSFHQKNQSSEGRLPKMFKSAFGGFFNR